MVQLKISPLEKEILFGDHHFQVNRVELEVYGGCLRDKICQQ